MTSLQPEVPRRIRLFYGLGSIAEGTKDTAFNVFLLFYYHNVLGLPGVLAGLAIFLALCADALTDPLIGSLSDKTRTRLGRRHPYMYAASLPLPVLFWLVFDPPAGLGTTELFLWLTVFSFLLRTCLSLYSVPSNAMAAELTRRYDERTEVVGYRFLFGWIAGLAVAVIGFTVFFAPAGDGSDGRLARDAYANFALFCGCIAAGGVFLCAHGTRSAIPRLRRAMPAQQSMRRFGSELRQLFANPSFRALLGSVVFAAAAWGYLNAVGYYMNTYFWGLEASSLGLLTVTMFGSVALAVAAAPRIGRRFDKKRAAIGLKLAGLVIGPLPIALRYYEMMPANGTLALLLALLVHTFVVTAVVIAVQILGASMVADTTDQGELLHAERREGLYAAVTVFAVKASTGVGGLCAGLTLDLVRFPRQLDIAEVPPGAVDALGYTVGPVLIALFLISAALLLGYRLNRESHAEIVRALEPRHG